MKAVFTGTQKIILVVMFMAAANLWQMGTIFVFGAFIILALEKCRLSVDRAGWILIAFAVMYMIMKLLNSIALSMSFTAAFRALIFPCCYIISYTILCDVPYMERKKTIENLVLIVAVSMAIHSVVSFANTTINGGINQFSSGRSIDFWSGSLSTATGQLSYYFFIAAVLPYVLFAMKGSLKKYAILALYAVCFFHDILLGGRTFIGLSIISLFIGFSISSIVNKHKQRLILTIVSIGIVAGIIVIIYANNSFGLKDTIDGSYFYHRFFADTAYKQDLTASARWQDKLTYIQNFFNYPFGGNHLLNEVVHNYAHELWLDTFDNVGWIPFFILWIYTFRAVGRCIRILKSSIDFSMKIMVGSVTTTLLASFFMEPILVGCPMVFAMFCFYDGALSSIIINKKKKV